MSLFFFPWALLVQADTGRLPAELVLSGGNVITLDGAHPQASAIAVGGGRIVAVGEWSEIAPLVGPATRRIELAGRTVVPGLTDAHLHVEALGESLESLNLSGAATRAEAVKRVEEAGRATPPGQWILGRGWDQTAWPDKRFPTAADLDAAVSDRPVFLTRVDGHAAWVNTRAMQLAGLSAATADPSGGRLLRDSSGAPAGVLIDHAQQLVRSHIPPPTRQLRKQRLARSLRACAAAGLTSVHDAGIGMEALELYKELLSERALPIRVYVMLRSEEFLKTSHSYRPEVGLGDGLLTVRAVKVIADGALGSRGARLLAPYADEPATLGLRLITANDLHLVLREALARGFQVNTHAIGDAANRMVLDAYEETSAKEARLRIEHAQVVSARDVPRFKTLGVIASVQPTHCTSDMRWAEERLGPERAKGAYLWKTFLNEGVQVAGGSDAPVESVAPLPGLYAAVTRQDAAGHPPQGWHPAERVSILEALRMFSQGAAYAAFEETERGTIAPGRRADLTILTKDVTSIPPREILETEIAMTIVGGNVVFALPSGSNPSVH